MSIIAVRCPSCGSPLDFPDNASQVVCSACGNVIQSSALPTLVSSQITKPEITSGDKAFEVIMWCLFIIPGAVYNHQKTVAERYFQRLIQKINHDASQIENYLEQRVIILENLSALIKKEMDFEKDALKTIVLQHSAREMNEAASEIGSAEKQIRNVFDKHPELMSNAAIEKAMRDNDYLQREITAARECYNDSINEWNQALFATRAQKVVAAKKGYKTRVPFITTAEIRDKARKVLF